MIDHSLLRPEMTDAALESGATLALELDVASVCALPYFTPRLRDILRDSTVRTSTVVGFPHGSTTTKAKLFEVEEATRAGCEEVDFVVNISQVKSGAWEAVEREIGALVAASHAGRARAKVIFETCYLTDEEKARLCAVCAEHEADWVKTSTGFGSHGATPHDVRLLREKSPAFVAVKASGGIRTLDQLLEFREMGATRVGSSATSAILDECRARLSARGH